MAAGAAEASCQIGRLRRITTGQRHRDLAILMHAVDLQYGDHGDSKQHTQRSGRDHDPDAHAPRPACRDVNHAGCWRDVLW